MITDERYWRNVAVERAAKELHGRDASTLTWVELADSDREFYRSQALAALAPTSETT